MNINLPNIKSTSEKLRRILRSYKQVELPALETLRKLLCKPKDWGDTEDKNNISYVVDCRNCEAFYFGESKRSLKSRSDEHKDLSGIAIAIRMKLQNTFGKQITTIAGIKRKLLIGKAG